MALAGSKRRALLALLLVHANETLSIERLIDELWGEYPPATAARTVQAHVSRLRKALRRRQRRGGAIVTREHGYQLTLDPERLDAHHFERLVAEGRRELAAGHPQRAAAAFEAALSLWRGAPLAGLAKEPFVPARGGPLGGSAGGRAGGPGRGQAGARAPQRAGRAARGADRRASLSRAPACPVDAGPVPLRAPGRCAPGLPGRAHGPWSKSWGSSPASVCGNWSEPILAQDPALAAPAAAPPGGRRGRTRPRRSANGGGHLPADRHRGLVGPVGGGCRRDGGCARAARRPDRASRERTRRAAAEGKGRGRRDADGIPARLRRRGLRGGAPADAPRRRMARRARPARAGGAAHRRGA